MLLYCLGVATCVKDIISESPSTYNHFALNGSFNKN